MIIELKTDLAVRESGIDGTMLVTPDQVEAFLGDIRELAQEVFVVVSINAKNKVIQRHLVSIGTVNSTLVHPRECFRPAILDGASAVICAHNHPSEEQCKEEAPLVTRFCYNELRKLDLLPAYTRAVDKVKALQDFFGVMSLNQVLELPRYQVAFRHKAQAESERSPEAVAAWLRVGETVARKADCAPFDANRIKSSLDELRAMTRKNPEQFSGPLASTLAQAGVILVPCPHFPKTKAHGATFFLRPEKAVLMVTLRYNWADIFWFSLFHELGHILLHGTKSVILEDSQKNRKEEEADVFARDCLIEPDRWASFIRCREFDNRTISRFAKQAGVAPGIVVGRLQHEGYLEQHQGNELRTRYVFSNGTPAP